MKQTESTDFEFFRLSPAEWSVGVALAFLILLEGAIFKLGPSAIVVGALTLPLAWRRRWPVAVFCSVGLSAFITPTPYFTVIAAMIAMYAVGLYSQHEILALGLLFALALLLILRYQNPAPSIPGQFFPFVILIISWLFAWAVRQQQNVAEAYRQRSVSLESEQEQATRAARAEERRRIAREMHDVIAHSVSVMVVQAGAARSVLDSAPEEATNALLAVETTGRDTLAELRGLLGVLSDHDDSGALVPQPGLEQFEALIERVTAAGLNVAVQTSGEVRPLSSGLSLTAYRVLQEALTNALKHADHARAEVILTYTDESLKLEILNSGSNGAVPNREPGGHGLVGMRERVELFGGRLESGPRLGGGYAVRAWLPLKDAAE
jgi:signal transduction histidine kinase